MKKTLKEELERNHKLLYGKSINEQKLKDFLSNLFSGKKNKESETKSNMYNISLKSNEFYTQMLNSAESANKTQSKFS